MIRRFYSWLVSLHPPHFRGRFGEEMLWIFEQAAGIRARTLLLADAAASLARQWVLRSEFRAQPLTAGGLRTARADGVPVFYTFESSLPRAGALVDGALLSVAVFGLVSLAIASGRRSHPFGTRWFPASRHASDLSALAQTTALPSAAPATRLGSLLALSALSRLRHPQPLPETPGRPPGHPTDLRTPLLAANAAQVQPQESAGGHRNDLVRSHASEYFQVLTVLGALDADHDGVISASEIARAPAVLRSLDKNRDGKLSPEECGQSFRGAPKAARSRADGTRKVTNPRPSPRGEATPDPQFVERARLGFMRFHAVHAALDADHDGEISAKEISNAPAALQTLDKNGDGKLTAEEVLPDPVANQVGVFMRLDHNGDGRISKDERSNEYGKRIQEVLDGADRNQDGFVTEAELTSEIRRRADLNQDGIVTREELLKAHQSRAFGMVGR